VKGPRDLTKAASDPARLSGGLRFSISKELSAGRTLLAQEPYLK